jgi:PAS domain S-box-containing protein
VVEFQPLIEFKKFMNDLIKKGFSKNKKTFKRPHENVDLSWPIAKLIGKLLKNELSVLKKITPLIDRVDDGVIAFDVNGLIQVNEKAVRQFGYKSHREFISNPLPMKVIDLKTGKLVTKNTFPSTLVLRGIDVTDREYIVENPIDKREWIAKVSGRIALDMAGERIGILVIKDLTANRKVEEVRAYLDTIIKSSNDAIVGETIDGIITSWNKGAEKLFGYKADEVIGKHAHIFVPKEKREKRGDVRTYLERKGAPHESIRVTKSGKIIPVSVTHSPIYAYGKIIGLSTITRDISKEKELERRKDEFISIASHELKTPVTSLKAFSQLLESRLKYLKDYQSVDYVERMSTQINKITELVNDLMDVNKIEAGRLKYHIETFRLDEIINEAVKDIRAITAGTHKIILSENAKVRVKGDRFRLTQVLNNFLVNAVKYSNYNTKVTVSSKIIGSKVEVCVKDEGIGISKENQKKIFDKFFQANSPLTTSGKGSGLGLFIASEIIKRHNSEIRIRSNHGKGSIFCFKLDIVKSN